MYTVRGLSLLVSAPVALVSAATAAIASGDVSATAILVLFAITLAAGYGACYLILRRIVFRDLEDLLNGLDNVALDTEDTAFEDDLKTGPVRAAFSRVRALLRGKQQEIDRLGKIEVFRKEFIADVSHELKTPIFAAQGFVHTLIDGAAKEKGVRKKFLKKAAKSLDRLDVLVQDLLTLSQIETGQIKMRFGEVDLYALTEEVFEQLKGKANKKNLVLRIEGPSRKISAHADSQRIEQVITNLVSNAIKHSDEGGEVVVSFKVQKNSVITRVSDSGEGIPEEHIGRIFERFYRVDKSRSREKGGTGLGLAIVKHILEGHNSKATVKSEPGKGATFSFRLPRTKTEDNGNGQDRQPEE